MYVVNIFQGVNGCSIVHTDTRGVYCTIYTRCLPMAISLWRTRSRNTYHVMHSHFSPKNQSPPESPDANPIEKIVARIEGKCDADLYVHVCTFSTFFFSGIHSQGGETSQQRSSLVMAFFVSGNQ